MRRNVGAAVGLGLLLAAFVVVLRLRIGDPFVGRVIDDLGQAGAALIACLLCLWRSHRVSGRWWLSWTLLGLALGSWTIGELTWSYYELLSKH
jgi:hypothetical protein